MIDITETGQRHGPDKIAVGQQTNYDTLIQVIGLRGNPTPKDVKRHTGSISDLNLGKDFKGKHNYWEFNFEIEYGGTSIEMLEQDFNLVPVVTDLNETIKIDKKVFNTTDITQRNIIFKHIEDK